MSCLKMPVFLWLKFDQKCILMFQAVNQRQGSITSSSTLEKTEWVKGFYIVVKMGPFALGEKGMTHVLDFI